MHRRSRAPRPARAALFGALCAAVLVACSGDNLIGLRQPGGIPGASWSAEVKSVVPRGDYLDATLHVWGGDLRFFFPSDESCSSVLKQGAAIRWVETGTFGRAQFDEEECDALGVLSLAAWRDSRARVRSRPLPSKQASFRIVGKDEDFTYARGRFPMTGFIGIPNLADLIAVIPNVPACQKPLESGVATLTYNDNGPTPFTLAGANAPCPIQGFVIPLAEKTGNARSN